MPFWLVYMEIYGADFLTPSFLICVIKHHHHQEKVNAEKMFREIGEAYEILTDVDKRRHYDEGVDVEDLDRPQGIYIYIHITYTFI
jgi:uncharacterized lipoprotein YehR (DUF1307 family)